jgi:hypothetical protein
MDLTHKLKDFFNSDCSSFKEFEQVLKEANTITDWANAVNMFRLGMKKLKDNDLTGLEEIKKSNEMIKAVVETRKKDEVVKEAQSLNEAIEKVDAKKAGEAVEALGLHLSALYEALKVAGLPAMLNESEMYEDCPVCEEEVKDECVGSTPAAVVIAKEDAPMAAPTAQSTQPPTASTPGAAPTATVTPTPSPTPAGAAPVAPMPTVKESAYEHGFNEARKRYIKGGNSKAMAKDIAEKELSEKPYSYVTRYMEGFASGHAFHEEVMRDTDGEVMEEAK